MNTTKPLKVKRKSRILLPVFLTLKLADVIPLADDEEVEIALPIIKPKVKDEEAKMNSMMKPKTPMKSKEADGGVSEDADTEEASGLDPEEVRLRFWRIETIVYQVKDLIATMTVIAAIVKETDEWACTQLWMLFKAQ